MPTVPKAEVARRISDLQNRLAAMAPALDAAVVIQGADLYYLSGTIQTSHLIVPREGLPRLLVRKVLERAREDSPIEDVRPMASLKNLAAEIESLCGPPPWRLGLELDVLPYNTVEMYRGLLGTRAEIHDVSPRLLAGRAVKSPWEIDRIRDAALIGDRIYKEVGGILKEGMSTFDLQSALDSAARRGGHVGMIRLRGINVDGLLGLVVSGPTGAMPGHAMFPIGGKGPHPCLAHGGDFEPIRRDTPVIFDYLSNVEGYHHDQTRLAVVGRLTDEAARIYEGMREVLRLVESRLSPGAIPSRIYQESVEKARDLGLADGFQGRPPYAVTFIGHGIGLEVNETPVLAPRFDDPLVKGNVFAVEPKFNHPALGVIGLENTYAVTGSGALNLSSTPEAVVAAP